MNGKQWNCKELLFIEVHMHRPELVQSFARCTINIGPNTSYITCFPGVWASVGCQLVRHTDSFLMSSTLMKSMALILRFLVVINGENHYK